MRTVSAKHPKGQEPPRTFMDNVRLLVRIASMGIDYLFKGHKLRKAFYERQRAKEKIYIDDPDWI